MRLCQCLCVCMSCGDEGRGWLLKLNPKHRELQALLIPGRWTGERLATASWSQVDEAGAINPSGSNSLPGRVQLRAEQRGTVTGTVDISDR